MIVKPFTKPSTGDLLRPVTHHLLRIIRHLHPTPQQPLPHASRPPQSSPVCAGRSSPPPPAASACPARSAPGDGRLPPPAPAQTRAAERGRGMGRSRHQKPHPVGHRTNVNSAENGSSPAYLFPIESSMLGETMSNIFRKYINATKYQQCSRL